MKRLLYPDHFAKSIFDIDDVFLKSLNIEALIIDIDNTLTEYEKKCPDEGVIRWVENLKNNGFSICLISNNNKKKAENFTKALNLPVIYNAAKPSRRPFKKAIKILKAEGKKIAIIGDQIFTDILGGNRMGFYTILVEPLSSKDFIFTRLIRKLEKIVLKHYRRSLL